MVDGPNPAPGALELRFPDTDAANVSCLLAAAALDGG